MFIYEITRIRNLQTNILGVFEIYHPDLKEIVRGQGAAGLRHSVFLTNGLRFITKKAIDNFS